MLLFLVLDWEIHFLCHLFSGANFVPFLRGSILSAAWVWAEFLLSF